MRLRDSLRISSLITRRVAHASTESYLVAVFSLLHTAILLFALFSVYSAGIGHAGEIKGMTLAATLWSLSMYSINWGIGMRTIFRDVSDDVKDGTIEMRLTRPFHYFWFVASLRLGRQVPLFFPQLFLNLVFLFLFVGFPPVELTFAWIAGVTGLFVFGNFLAFLLYTCVGMSAFWIDDATPVMWFVDKLVMILGGAYVPVAFFPQTFRLIAEWSPFGAVIGFSQAFSPDFVSRLPYLFLSQGVWVLFLGILLAFMWRFALRRIVINGG